MKESSHFAPGAEIKRAWQAGYDSASDPNAENPFSCSVAPHAQELCDEWNEGRIAAEMDERIGLADSMKYRAMDGNDYDIMRKGRNGVPTVVGGIEKCIDVAGDHSLTL